MQYMGSKNRIAKEIFPIMDSAARERGASVWIEPFVGGANMLDKVPDTYRRIGIDYSPHVIKALIAVRDFVDLLPEEVSEQYYREIRDYEPDPIRSWVRFVCSFGAKFNAGYARNKAGQNYAKAGVSNAKKQSPNIQGTELINASYEYCSSFKNCIIYCDPPYEGTSSYKTGAFDHIKFWDWCRRMAVHNLVFVSEYNAPEDFICVWAGEIKTNFASQRTEATHKAVERLFTHKMQKYL